MTAAGSLKLSKVKARQDSDGGPQADSLHTGVAPAARTAAEICGVDGEAT